MVQWSVIRLLVVLHGMVVPGGGAADDTQVGEGREGLGGVRKGGWRYEGDEKVCILSTADHHCWQLLLSLTTVGFFLKECLMITIVFSSQRVSCDQNFTFCCHFVSSSFQVIWQVDHAR